MDEINQLLKKHEEDMHSLEEEQRHEARLRRKEIDRLDRELHRILKKRSRPESRPSKGRRIKAVLKFLLY